MQAVNPSLARVNGLGGADLIAATEGAVVLARAARNRTPFDTVAQSLLEQARAL